MRAAVQRRQRNSAVITRGPLVYSLPIGEDWRVINGDPPKADYEVHPITPWNYALVLDPNKPDQGITFTDRKPGDFIFSAEGTPVAATAQAKRVPGWTIEKNAAQPAPQSPVSTAEPAETITLVPYGAARLRVTEFPVAE